MSSGSRNSVGPAFQVAPTVVDGFVDVTSNDVSYEDVDLTFTQFLGISNNGNLCYRNAVLTALLSPASVVRYLVLWHRQVSDDENHSPSQSIPSKLAQLSARLFGNNQNRAATKSQDQIQADVDDKVRQFWRQFCYPRDNHGVSLAQPPEGSWRARGGEDEYQQQDASDFLLWLMEMMPESFGPAPGSIGPSERYNWLFKSRLVDRVMCERCKYPVRLRRAIVEPTACLILDISTKSRKSVPGRGVATLLLDDLVNDAMHVKQLDRRCARCKEIGGCVEEKQFQHTPTLLTLILSRGIQGQNGNQRKNRSAVLIPDQLDISKHLNIHEFGEGSSVTYSLSSVVSHVGRQLNGGHYVSYVRGGRLRDEWAELSDRIVTSVNLADFDESGVAALGGDEFKDRPTPYILFYERNFATDVIVPGRSAINVNEGENEDERPTHWTGGKAVKINVADGEGAFPPAVLQVTVTIGEIEIELPRHIISHLRWTKPRTIKIDAKLRIPKGKRRRVLDNPDHDDYKEVSLSGIQNEEYLEQGRHERKDEPIQKKRKIWRDKWRDVKRDSTDLTLEELKKLR